MRVMKVMRVTMNTRMKKLKIKNNLISKKRYMRSNCKKSYKFKGFNYSSRSKSKEGN